MNDLYTIDAAIWSIGGFVAGFVTCSIVGLVQEARAKDVSRTERSENEALITRRMVAAVLIGMALLVVFVGWRSAVADKETALEQRDKAERALAISTCQTKFNQGVFDVLNDRDVVAEQGRNQLRDVFSAVIKAVKRRGDLGPAIKLMQEYVHSVDERQKMYDELKIPTAPPPDCTQAGKTKKTGEGND